MLTRRDFLQTSMAASAILGGSGFSNWSRFAAHQALTQYQSLDVPVFGNVTIAHVTDREGAVEIGYRNFPDGGKQEIQSLLDGIARAAAEQ